MRSVNIREARRKLSDLVDAAERGQSVTITRHGKEVAKLGPSGAAEGAPLPELTEFRQAIRQAIGGDGEALSKTVVRSRETARY